MTGGVSFTRWNNDKLQWSVRVCAGDDLITSHRNSRDVCLVGSLVHYYFVTMTNLNDQRKRVPLQPASRL